MKAGHIVTRDPINMECTSMDEWGEEVIFGPGREGVRRGGKIHKEKFIICTLHQIQAQ
jgi:hypothetical protein